MFLRNVSGFLTIQQLQLRGIPGKMSFKESLSGHNYSSKHRQKSGKKESFENFELYRMLFSRVSTDNFTKSYGHLKILQKKTRFDF